MHLLILLAAITFTSLSNVFSVRRYQQWQCSMPSRKSVYSLVKQNFEAFDLLDNPSWLTKKHKYVSCFQKGLKFIPHGLAPDVEILNFDKNSISRIRKNDFKNYPSLVAITLLENCVELDFYYVHHQPRCQSSTELTIEAGAFLHLQNLSYLALSGNTMQHLPEMLPKSILVLFVSFSSLKPVEKEEVKHLNNLEIISLSTNCITGDSKHLCQRNFTIRSPVFAAPNLTYLDLSYNNFSQIPSYLFQQSLLGIKLRGNPFHHVHINSFLNATKIRYLNLAWTSLFVNHMHSLHIDKGAFNFLLELRVLDLSGNMIKSLPSGFLGKNVKLNALNLELNCLKNIEINPNILPVLPLLEELYLVGNNYCHHNLYPNLTVLPKLEVGQAYLHFPNLTTLAIGMFAGIRNSSFSHICPYLYFFFATKYDKMDGKSLETLKKLPQLRRITFIGCGIRILDTSAFSGFNLTYLGLGANQIDEPPIHNVNEPYFDQRKLNSFSDMFSRESCEIEPKSYHRISSDLYTTKSVVDLSNNGISNLTRYSMKYFDFTNYLDLSHNHINYIDSATFLYLKKLQVLNLAFNPIRRIHPSALMYLVSLSEMRINISVFQNDITLDFLAKAQQNLSLQFGDQGANMYRLLQFYGKRSIFFPKVVSIDVSGIPIPLSLLHTNQIIFRPFLNLKILTMNQAKLAYKIQSKFFQGLSHLQNLSMMDSWLEEFPSEALQNMTSLMFLDLSYNKIEILNLHSLPTFPKLKTLCLSHNFIFKIDPGVLQFLQKCGVQKIDLSFNQIHHIGPAIINRALLKNLQYLDLRGSFVNCECSLDNTFGWLVDSGIVNHTELPGFVPICSSMLINYYGGCIACADSYKSASKDPISLFTFIATNKCQERILSVLVGIFIFCFVLFFSLAMISTNVQLKKKLTNFLLKDIRLQFASDKESKSFVFAYDGLIFYDRNNKSVGDWVDQQLVPRLENGNVPFKMCIAGKEDWCGATHVQQLLVRMRASRKTIIILSKKFVSTPECQYVLSVLEKWVYSEKNHKGIIITFGNHRPTLISKALRKVNEQTEYSIMHYSTSHTNPLFWTLLENAMAI